MGENIAKRNPNRGPTHPGALLREDILRERKPVSAEVVVRLGAAFGDGPEVWLHMQAAYDAWHASRKVDVSKVPRLAA